MMEQEKYKVSLEHLVVPENKRVPKKKKKKGKGISKGHRNQPDEFSMAKRDLSKKRYF